MAPSLSAARAVGLNDEIISKSTEKFGLTLLLKGLFKGLFAAVHSKDSNPRINLGKINAFCQNISEIAH